MRIRSSAVLPVCAPVCCGRSIFSVSLKYPHRALCLSLSLFYLYEWFCSRNKCLSANFFFFSPLEEKMNCMSVCADNGWKTNRICFGGVFIYVFSELDVKVPFKTAQTHQLLCFKWRLKFSAFQESRSKGWNNNSHWSLCRRGFHKDTLIPISEVEKQTETGRDFCRGACQRAMANPGAQARSPESQMRCG